MSRLPVVTDRELLRLLQRAEFYVDRVRGSHAVLLHSGKPGVRVVLAVHGGDLHPSELKRLLRAARITPDEFRQLL